MPKVLEVFDHIGNGNFYYLNDSQMTMADAQKFCGSLESSVAGIETEEYFKAVRRMRGRHECIYKVHEISPCSLHLIISPGLVTSSYFILLKRKSVRITKY